MLKHSTLEDAVTLTRLQEGGFYLLLAKAKTSSNTKQNAPASATYRNYQTANQPTATLFSYKPLTTTNNSTTKPDTKTPTLPNKFTTPNAAVPVKKITPAEMQARREVYVITVMSNIPIATNVKDYNSISYVGRRRKLKVRGKCSQKKMDHQRMTTLAFLCMQLLEGHIARL